MKKGAANMDQPLKVKIDYIWDGSEDSFEKKGHRIAQISLTFTHFDFGRARLSPDEQKVFSKELLLKLQPIAGQHFGGMVGLRDDGVRTGSITVTVGLVLLSKAAVLIHTNPGVAEFAKDTIKVATAHGIYTFIKDYKDLRESILKLVEDIRTSAGILSNVARASYSRIQKLRKKRAESPRHITH